MSPDGFTIGEVLNQLKEDFEDITISKIRFLESEGLISPDRTESGYRKFSDDDIDRLRFILTAQRDHYLPLKVIRDQLDRLDSGEQPAVAPAPSPPIGVTVRADTSAIPNMPPAPPTAGIPDGPWLDAPLTGERIGITQLCEKTGLSPTEARSLQEFGLIGERGTDELDGDDLLVAETARDLLRMGLEARHLRMYQQFTDRELALFEQLAGPLLLQRQPEARRQGVRQLERLSALTASLRAALLSGALRDYVHGG